MKVVTNAYRKQPISSNSLFDFCLELKKRGLNEDTIINYAERLERINQQCDLSDPEQVRTFLANAKWKNSTKADLATKYDKYLEFIGGTWTKPNYKRESELPYIPTEKELDALINAGYYTTSTILQLLKETGARSGEIFRIKWTDINQERKQV